MKKIYWLSIYVLSILFAFVLSASAYNKLTPQQQERFLRSEVERCWEIIDTLVDDKPYVYNDEESTYISYHCGKQLMVREDETYAAEDIVLTSSDEKIVKILDNNIVVAMSRRGNALVTGKDKQGNELFSIKVVTSNPIRKLTPFDLPLK